MRMVNKAQNTGRCRYSYLRCSNHNTTYSSAAPVTVVIINLTFGLLGDGGSGSDVERIHCDRLQEGTCEVIEEWFWWVLDAGQSFQLALYTSGALEKAYPHQSIPRLGD